MRIIEPPSSHTVPHRIEDVIECELPEELLLHVPGDPEAIALNVSAQAVWELCDGQRSLEAIALDLMQRFEASPDEVRAAVHDVVRRLVRLRVLRLAGVTGPGDPEP